MYNLIILLGKKVRVQKGVLNGSSTGNRKKSVDTFNKKIQYRISSKVSAHLKFKVFWGIKIFFECRCNLGLLRKQVSPRELGTRLYFRFKCFWDKLKPDFFVNNVKNSYHMRFLRCESNRPQGFNRPTRKGNKGRRCNQPITLLGQFEELQV